MLRPLGIWLFLLLASMLAFGCATSQATGRGTPGLDPELTDYPYPFETHVHRVPYRGEQLRMTYMDVHPERPNGRTVLLLHGKNFSGAYWAPTIRALSERGFRVVAPDQIGFGKSSKPANYQFSFSALARNTMDLLDGIGVERFAVVGHSMGGMLATRVVLEYPARAEALVLVNPIGLEDYRKLAGYRTIEENYAAELATTPEDIRAYQQENYFAGNWKPEYDPYVEILAGWTAHPDYPQVAWNAALTTDMILTQPVLYEFPRLALPTLLVIGTRDRTALGKGWAPPEVAARMGNYEELGKETARRIPGATLVELPGLGHMPQVEDFDAYIEPILAFIDPS